MSAYLAELLTALAAHLAGRESHDRAPAQGALVLRRLAAQAARPAIEAAGLHSFELDSVLEVRFSCGQLSCAIEGAQWPLDAAAYAAAAAATLEHARPAAACPATIAARVADIVHAAAATGRAEAPDPVGSADVGDCGHARWLCLHAQAVLAAADRAAESLSAHRVDAHQGVEW